MHLVLSPKWAGLAAAPALTSGALVQTASAASSGQLEWTLGGQGFGNNRNQPDQTRLSAANASQLAVKWKVTLHGDVSSTPAVSGGVVYVTDWGVQVNGSSAAAPVGGGYLNALNEATGAIIWSKKLADYAGETPTAVSRTSPAVVDGIIYIGDQTGNVLAISAANGSLIWLTNIDPTQPGGLALVTQSPMVCGGKVYVGTGSNQEGAATNPYSPCCTHRGSFSALNATTGEILWTFFTEPPNDGPPPQAAGGGVWGSTAAVDPASGTVYIATGNDYSTTAAAQACHVKAVPTAIRHMSVSTRATTTIRSLPSTVRPVSPSGSPDRNSCGIPGTSPASSHPAPATVRCTTVRTTISHPVRSFCPSRIPKPA